MSSKSKLSIEFEGGTETIGGNIVVLEAANERVDSKYLFDFGVPIDVYRSQAILGSEPQTLEDFVRRGLVPDLDMDFRACFLSHAHPDHCIALNALYRSRRRPGAIWATKTTSKLLKQIQFVEKPLLTDPFEREDYYEDQIAKGGGLDVKIALYPVDHDIPGACCFLAMVNNTLVIYTGDFRDHGFLSDVINRQFWSYVGELRSKSNFDSCVVVCEGTNFGLPFDFRSQSDFDNRMAEILKNYSKQLVSVIVNRDGLWDIFSTIKNVRTRGIGRKIVVSTPLADFVGSIREPFLEDYRRAVTEEGLSSFQQMTDLGQFIVYDQRRSDSVELLRKIAMKPSDYLVFFTRNEAFNALERVSMLSGHAGGCCILSFSAFETSFDSTIRTFSEAIGRIGFCVERTNALARGHVSPHRLTGILKTIDPDQIFVMHTLAPEGLRAFLQSHLDCDVVAPSTKKQYKL